MSIWQPGMLINDRLKLWRNWFLADIA